MGSESDYTWKGHTASCTTTQDSKAVLLLVAQASKARAKMLRNLNEQLFADGGSYRPVAPVTVATRLQRLIQRMRVYLTTLGKALAGRELTEPCSCEDW